MTCENPVSFYSEIIVIMIMKEGSNFVNRKYQSKTTDSGTKILILLNYWK